MAQHGTTRGARRGTHWFDLGRRVAQFERAEAILSSRYAWGQPEVRRGDQQRDDRAPVVSVMGEVDLATALALEQTLLGAVEDGKGEVIVDFTGFSFLDSRGLRALITTRTRLGARTAGWRSSCRIRAC